MCENWNELVTERSFYFQPRKNYLQQEEVYCREYLEKYHMHVRERFALNDQWIIDYWRLHQIHVVPTSNEVDYQSQ